MAIQSWSLRILYLVSHGFKTFRFAISKTWWSPFDSHTFLFTNVIFFSMIKLFFTFCTPMSTYIQLVIYSWYTTLACNRHKIKVCILKGSTCQRLTYSFTCVRWNAHFVSGHTPVPLLRIYAYSLFMNTQNSEHMIQHLSWL